MEPNPADLFAATDEFPLPEIFDAENFWDMLGRKDRILKDRVGGRHADVPAGVSIKGPVQIGEGTVLEPGTCVYATPELPVLIGDRCTIGPNCYIRPGTVLGHGVHIGAAVEVKGSIVGNNTQIPHFSYVGDSIAGARVNMGAGYNWEEGLTRGFISANLKFTKSPVRVRMEGRTYETGLRKFGCVIGDGSQIGVGVCTAPGTVIGKNAWVDMGSNVEGFVPSNTRYHRDGTMEPLEVAG